MPEPTAALARLTMISPQQAADMLSVDRETVLRWVRDGKLFASKLSPKIIRVRLADIETMIQRNAL